MIYTEGKEKFFVRVCKYCKKPMIERDLSLYGKIYVCPECLEEQCRFGIVLKKRPHAR